MVTGGAFSPSASAFLDNIPNSAIDKPFKPAARRCIMLTIIN
jgi:hypothetical protein